MIETDQLLYERRGQAAFATFNRPEARNAMTWEMYDALLHVAKGSTQTRTCASSCCAVRVRKPL